MAVSYVKPHFPASQATILLLASHPEELLCTKLIQDMQGENPFYQPEALPPGFCAYIVTIRFYLGNIPQVLRVICCYVPSRRNPTYSHPNKAFKVKYVLKLFY